MSLSKFYKNKSGLKSSPEGSKLAFEYKINYFQS